MIVGLIDWLIYILISWLIIQLMVQLVNHLNI